MKTRFTVAKQQASGTGVEVAPLLIIGILTLVALSLWLWRGTNLQTSARPSSLVVLAPGGSVQPPPPRPAVETELRVPVLPEGVVSSHWRPRAVAVKSRSGVKKTGAATAQNQPHSEAAPQSEAVLLRPDGSELGLTLVPQVQRNIKRRLERVRVPYGAVVLMDVHSGAIKAWVEHQEAGEPAGEGNGLTRAVAPAASVFKIVTAAALLESGAQPETETCFHGGHHSITRKMLNNSAKDTECESLAMSLARSSNVAFGKQAVQRLSAGALTATAEDLFFGKALPFDVQAAPSAVNIGNTDLALARAAAGFVGTTLSPLHGAALAAAVANQGVLMHPYLVSSDSLQPGRVRTPKAIGRVMSGSVARDLREMMALTLTDGTGRLQFRSWPKALEKIQVAGKTGTLVRNVDGVYRHYTWFVGFAPAEDPQIAVAALAVNGKKWRIRGPSLARHALASWFLSAQGRAARSDKSAAQRPAHEPRSSPAPAAVIR